MLLVTERLRRPNPRRSKVFKYRGAWYGQCGQCSETIQTTSWRSTWVLLEFHLLDH